MAAYDTGEGKGEGGGGMGRGGGMGTSRGLVQQEEGGGWVGWQSTAATARGSRGVWRAPAAPSSVQPRGSARHRPAAPTAAAAAKAT